MLIVQYICNNYFINNLCNKQEISTLKGHIEILKEILSCYICIWVNCKFVLSKVLWRYFNEKYIFKVTTQVLPDEK